MQGDMKIKFKHKIYTRRGIVARILHYYSLATFEEVLDGMSWYDSAHLFCVKTAEDFGITPIQVAGVVAALSPMQNWDINKDNTVRFLNGDKAVHTLAQVSKAEACLETNSPEEIFKLLSKNGVKTSQFFWNIAFPDSNKGVTIDRHAIAVSVFSPSNLAPISEPYGKLSASQYKAFEEAFRRAAEIKNILPHQMQAVTWGVLRRLRGLASHKGLEINEREVAF